MKTCRHLVFLNLAHCTLFEKSYILYRNKYIKTYKINSRAMNMCAFLKIKKKLIKIIVYTMGWNQSLSKKNERNQNCTNY